VTQVLDVDVAAARRLVPSEALDVVRGARLAWRHGRFRDAIDAVAG
jgi:hypothetical protein